MRHKPVPFTSLFSYATYKDLLLLTMGTIFILYSSFNIPLVNIVYGMMMRDMNDFVAKRAQILNIDTDKYNFSATSPKPFTTATTTTTLALETTALPTQQSSWFSSSQSSAFNTGSNNELFDAETDFKNSSFKLCSIVIFFGATRFVTLYLALLSFSVAASNQAKRVKLLFFKSLLRQEVSWFECNRTGDFAIRITSDLSKFEDGIGEKIALCLNALFAWISSIVTSFYYGWELTLVCLILVPLIVVITTIIAEFQATYSMKETNALSQVFSVCHEVISSIRTILAFSGQERETKRLEDRLTNVYRYGLKRNIYSGLNLGFTWMSGYLGFAICLLYSTKFYKPEYLGMYDEAQIITILWSAAGCVFLLNRMMPFIEVIQMARGSASNLFAVIERKSTIDPSSEEGLKLHYFEANVKFNNVCFTYPSLPAEPSNKKSSSHVTYAFGVKRSAYGAKSQATSTPISSSQSAAILAEPSTKAPQVVVTDLDALDSTVASSDVSTSGSQQTTKSPVSSSVSMSDSSTNTSDTEEDDSNFESPKQGAIKSMSLEVKAGQTVALVGPSGSGKSTALALLQRFYQLNSGSITLDGHDISLLNVGWLREQLGVVTQEPVLFDMSIADNIRLGARPHQTVSDQDIEQAARSANAHSFISALPEGYETRAGARGVQLSGGQKQRIAIARALIRQPKILLLDEATSALDLESESIVQQALDKARIGRTTFIVAHRLSSVRNADKIIVFDKGSIVEIGTHEELTKKRGLYYLIHSQQKRGIDLVPKARRDSLIGPPAGVVGVVGRSSALIKSEKMQEYNRETRSMSIYSTTGKFGSNLGATGHGGNGDAVDSGGGSCAPDVKFSTDDDYYNRNHDEEDDEDTDDDDDVEDDGTVNSESESSSSKDLKEVPEESGTSNAETIQIYEGPLEKATISTTAAKLRASSITSQVSQVSQSSRASASKFVSKGHNVGEDPQASLLDMESMALINSKGKNIQNLSFLSMLRFIKPDLPCTIVGIVTSLLMGLCIPISAMIIGDIATIFATDKPEEIRYGLYTHGLLYVILAVFALLVSFVQVVSCGLAGEKIGSSLRIRGLKAILNRDITWFDNKRNNPGSMCARLASDVGNVQSITGNRTAVIFQSISVLTFTFIFAVYFNLKFSSICVGFVAILLFSTVMQAHYAGKLALASRNFDSQIGKIVLESSSNIKTVVSLHQETFFINRCESLINSDNRCWTRHNHLRLALESMKYAMTAISKGSSFYFAAHMLVNNEIQVDDIFKLIEIILYGLTEASKSLIFLSDLEKARRGTQNLYKLINYSNNKQNDNANLAKRSTRHINKHHSQQQAIQSTSTYNHQHQDSAPPSKTRFSLNKQSLFGLRQQRKYRRLKDTFLNPDSNIDKKLRYFSNKNYVEAQIKGNLRFNCVKFFYPSRPNANVLTSLSLEIQAGKSIALVGRSGCGKSTIIQLLQKYYDSYQGEITIDGVDLRCISTEWLRKHIALVSQEPSLLSYSIGDNIRYGDNSREVDFREVVEAAQTANIHDFIMSLPNGYDTLLSESSTLQLSGGQKQRIAIARALVRKAPIMIFDEATSALDSKSEHVVQEALQKAQVGRTSIIVAHRLSTIKNVDCIYVLKDGVIVENGSHGELLEKKGEYYRLYKSQGKS